MKYIKIHLTFFKFSEPKMSHTKQSTQQLWKCLWNFLYFNFETKLYRPKKNTANPDVKTSIQKNSFTDSPILRQSCQKQNKTEQTS